MRKTARLIKFAHIAEPLLKKELSERDIVLVVKLLIVCTKIAEESNMSAPKNRGFFAKRPSVFGRRYNNSIK